LKIATATNPILRDNMRKRLIPLFIRNLCIHQHKLKQSGKIGT
jgi:hypothetical protein